MMACQYVHWYVCTSTIIAIMLYYGTNRASRKSPGTVLILNRINSNRRVPRQRESTGAMLVPQGKGGVRACARGVVPALLVRGFVWAGASERIEVTSGTKSSGRGQGVVDVPHSRRCRCREKGRGHSSCD
jgi:hypothetical protein